MRGLKQKDKNRAQIYEAKERIKDGVEREEGRRKTVTMGKKGHFIKLIKTFGMSLQA